MICSNRRNFLSGIVGATALSLLRRGHAAEPALTAVPGSELAADPRRPQFHLLPAANWMNDPNAPVYFQGRYHMFYQFNPNQAVWGDMHWGHAVSEDMVHWKHLPVALAPTPGGPDEAGCFTGTAVLQDGIVLVLYTAVHSAPEEQATSKDGPQSLRETQCLATTTDPELKSWNKLPTPVLSSPPSGMQVNGFRDPSPWRQGDWWYMVIGSGIANRGGAVLLYRSRDLRSWEFLHVLADRDGFGAHSPEAFDPWEVWECPEFFSLGEKHVLIYSTGGRAYWQSGELNPEAMTFRAEHSGLLDYGSMYAPKTQLDKHGNRILWGWVTEARPQAEFKAAGWAGLMSLPRVLSIGADGRLRTTVAEEVTSLRGREQKLDNSQEGAKRLAQVGSMQLESCCGEFLASVGRGQEPFMLALHSTAADTRFLQLLYDPLYPGQLTVDARPLPVPLVHGEDLEIRVLIDGSVMEIFAGGVGVWTKRFYPAGAKPQGVRLTWTGKVESLKSLSVWEMKPISSDRLTT